MSDEAEAAREDMRAAIIEMVLAALRLQGHPDISLDSLRDNPVHRGAMASLLDDCRPLPVILELKADVLAGRVEGHGPE